MSANTFANLSKTLLIASAVLLFMAEIDFKPVFGDEAPSHQLAIACGILSIACSNIAKFLK